MGNVGSVQRVVCSSYSLNAGKFVLPPYFKFRISLLLRLTQLQREGINLLFALTFVWYFIFVGILNTMKQITRTQAYVGRVSV